MSDSEKKNLSSASEESVDDILAGILNPDGSFNDEFNGLFAKYVGGNNAPYVPVNVDLSDRNGDVAVHEKVEYEAEDAFVPSEPTVDERIEEKLPESIREAFSQAAMDVTRPEFTASGDVRYPSVGVGASEQRVVYDADWEESAKIEAARRERVRQDRMLRGDSAYARSFVTREPYYNVPSLYYVQQPASPYIDPLSRDADLERPDQNSQYFSSTKKPFFPEGFSVIQKNNASSSGKTERTGSGNPYRNTYVSSDTSWLQVDEKPLKKKKRRFFGKKDETIPPERKPSVDEAIDAALNPSKENEPSQESTSAGVPYFAGERLDAVKEETAGLRSTVQEIVDKYNKRTQEEERRRLEELARQEEIRREAELRERRRLEEVRALKEQMGPELSDALDSAETEEAFDEYDDFSTEAAPSTKEIPVKNFGVVFDPSVISDGAYTEKIAEEADAQVTQTQSSEEENVLSDNSDEDNFSKSFNPDAFSQIGFTEEVIEDVSATKTEDADKKKKKGKKKKK